MCQVCYVKLPDSSDEQTLVFLSHDRDQTGIILLNSKYYSNKKKALCIPKAVEK